MDHGNDDPLLVGGYQVDVVLDRMQEARKLAEAEEKTKLLPAKGDD